MGPLLSRGGSRQMSLSHFYPPPHQTPINSTAARHTHATGESLREHSGAIYADMIHSPRETIAPILIGIYPPVEALNQVWRRR